MKNIICAIIIAAAIITTGFLLTFSPENKCGVRIPPGLGISADSSFRIQENISDLREMDPSVTS